MKTAIAFIITLAALLQSAAADFDLYAAGIGGNGIAGNAWGYQAYDGTGIEQSCGGVIDWIWRASGDVSGGKYGVRCADGAEGSCAPSGDPTGVSQVEVNFNSDNKHWSEYHSYIQHDTNIKT